MTFEEMGETSSALVLSKVENAASLELTSDDGACASIRELFEPKLEEIKSLCGDKQIPVPVAHENEGCEAGSVTKITLECRAVNLPPIPKEGCRDIEVKDDGAIPEGAELEAPLVCPRLGGAPPALEDGALPEPPAPPKNTTGERPAPPAPNGATPAKPPVPPKGIRCCAPPPPKS
ncbi:MAG: hypothetical protein KF837_38605 [Labilithrix sp.]|nr:hypothetical protein [Labilithrix sp.]